MNTHAFSPTVIALLVSAFALTSTHAHARMVKVQTHEVQPNARAHILEVSPGALPSAAHPDGTVFAVVSEKRDALTWSDFLAELDLETGAAIHRVELECDTVLNAGRHVFAVCSREVISLDPSLAIEWRARAGCPARIAGAGVRLAFDGSHTLVAVHRCDDGTPIVSTLDAATGRVLGTTPAPVFANRSVEIWFHGTTVLGHSRFEGPGYLPHQVFVLSRDYRRVAHDVDFGGGESIVDDGTNLHVSFTTEEFIERTDSDNADAANGELIAPRDRPRWLTLDRDFVLSDALVPVSSSVLDARPANSANGAAPEHVWYRPSVASGDRILAELDHGPVHMWLGTPCCGGGGHPGLFAGRVDRNTTVSDE
jgi:hypothetical protein